MSMNNFDNCRVFIVLNLIGGFRNTLGNGKGSKSSTLKFLAACKVVFVIFVKYFLSYSEMVSQIEAIAISVWSCGLPSASFEGWGINLFEVSFSFRESLGQLWLKEFVQQFVLLAVLAMRVRGEVFTKFVTAKFVFIPIKSQLECHRNLWFGPKNYFIWGFSSRVVDTCVVGECKLRC